MNQIHWMGRCSGFFGGISGYDGDDDSICVGFFEVVLYFRRAERRRREAAAARGEEEVNMKWKSLGVYVE